MTTVIVQPRRPSPFSRPRHWRLPSSTPSESELQPPRRIVDGATRRGLLHEGTGKEVQVFREQGRAASHAPVHLQRGLAPDVARLAALSGDFEDAAAGGIQPVV